MQFKHQLLRFHLTLVVLVLMEQLPHVRLRE